MAHAARFLSCSCRNWDGRASRSVEQRGVGEAGDTNGVGEAGDTSGVGEAGGTIGVGEPLLSRQRFEYLNKQLSYANL